MSALQESIDKTIDKLEEQFSKGTLGAAQWLYRFMGLVERDGGGGSDFHLDILKSKLLDLGYTGDDRKNQIYPHTSLEEKIDYLAAKIIQKDISPILDSIVTIEDLQAEERKHQQSLSL